MLFNSLSYLLFFPIMCILYWCISAKYRNALLLFASYFFYMSWEPAYAILIVFTSLSTWGCALLTDKYEKHKRFSITLCLIINLMILFVFKYYNFALDTITSMMSLADYKLHIERNLITYALFVSFFPQLVAGPIERAKNLLPQFHNQHKFNGDSFINGLKMMVWG